MANKLPGQMMNLLLLMGLERHTATGPSGPKHTRMPKPSLAAYFQPHQQAGPGKLKQQLATSRTNHAAATAHSAPGSPTTSVGPLLQPPASSLLQPLAKGRGVGQRPGQLAAEGALVPRVVALQGLEL